MTRKRRRTRKIHSAHAVSFMGFLGLLISATAWAHQAGVINWQLPDFTKPAIVATTQTTHVTHPASTEVASAETTNANSEAAAVGATAGASDKNCAEQMLGGKAPKLTNAALAEKTRKLCYTGFAVLNSGVTRTPLWAAEHLTAARVRTAQGLPRKNTFHADPNLPADERAELKDYKGYGYDRGHLAPNADMPDVVSQNECFTLANMMPQNKDNNEHLWAHIEESVRNLAERDADLYIVTGPIFDGDTVQQINGRVMVPTKIFKAVYDVKTQQASVYLVDNAAGDKYRVITLSQLEEIAGIEAFPGLSDKVRTAKLELPAPMASDLIN
jgi:endonuclease G